MSKSVVDASAILALLHAEPGWQIVEDHLPGLIISAVNYSEVVAKLADSGMPEEGIRSVLKGLALETHPFDELQGFQAGLLRPLTRKLGLSFGDRACIALGLSLAATILTTDKAWSTLGIGSIRVIR